VGILYLYIVSDIVSNIKYDMNWAIEMFRRRDEIRQQLLEVVEKFRQKGATGPEKAMTVEELGLPSEFKKAMKRRLGRSDVFVEVNGKYYLSEERLKEIKEKVAERRRRW